jgi:hypothetical protein
MGLSFLSLRRPLPVAVYDLGLGRAFRRPNKAYPELVVDADRVLPVAIARQRLKPVAWRRPQVADIARGVQVAPFPARSYLSGSLAHKLTCWPALQP